MHKFHEQKRFTFQTQLWFDIWMIKKNRQYSLWSTFPEAKSKKKKIDKTNQHNQNEYISKE